MYRGVMNAATVRSDGAAKMVTNSMELLGGDGYSGAVTGVKSRAISAIATEHRAGAAAYRTASMSSSAALPGLAEPDTLRHGPKK